MRALVAVVFSLVCLASGAVSLSGAALARDQVPAETRDLPWTGALPPCNDIWVLSFVSDHFAEKEAHYWNPALKITLYDQVRQVAARPWGLDYIPRRFCTARALTSDGVWRTVIYSVREALGVVSGTWGVEFCVVGLDRNYAYAPLCQMALP